MRRAMVVELERAYWPMATVAPPPVTVKALLVTMPAAVASRSSSNPITRRSPVACTTAVATAGGVVSTVESTSLTSTVSVADQSRPLLTHSK